MYLSSCENSFIVLQVQGVFANALSDMSGGLDRPDFLDLESHSACRASGRDGRYFPLTEVTPLIVVLHLFVH